MPPLLFIFLFVLLIIEILIFKPLTIHLSQKIRKHIYWSLNPCRISEEDSDIIRSIFTAQEHLNIPLKYTLKKEDTEFLRVVILAFQKNLNKNLLLGRYEHECLYDMFDRKIKKLAWYSKLSDFEFFIVSLNWYMVLRENKFCFEERALYYSNYRLTRDGFVFQKLLHICQEFCVHNSRINKYNNYIPDSRAETMDTFDEFEA